MIIEVVGAPSKAARTLKPSQTSPGVVTKKDVKDALQESFGCSVFDTYHIKALYKGKTVDLMDTDEEFVFDKARKLRLVLTDKKKIRNLQGVELEGDPRPKYDRVQSFPILEFQKNEHVLYYDKHAGTWCDAVIKSVDVTIRPASYCIDVYRDGIDHPPTSIQRETEANRLSKRNQTP
jgi:hypothetical protein